MVAAVGAQVQLEKLTETFQTVTEDLKRRFAVNGESLVDEANISGSSPMSAGNSPFRHGSVSGGSGGGFASQRGFALPHQRPTLASSGGILLVRLNQCRALSPTVLGLRWPCGWPCEPNEAVLLPVSRPRDQLSVAAAGQGLAFHRSPKFHTRPAQPVPKCNQPPGYSALKRWMATGCSQSCP